MERHYRNDLERVAYEKLFSTWDQAFVESPAGQAAVQDVLYNRQARADQFAVAWIRRHLDLKEATVVEVGCGTGAASVPLAQSCRRLVGLDIDPLSIEVAQARGRLAGVSSRAEFLPVSPDRLMAEAVSRAASTDVFVLFAVLEHLTPGERLDYLSSMWRALKAGGAIVIVETPNRLTWEDKHTAFMDFFHLLPDEYVQQYADRSPRPLFAQTMRAIEPRHFHEARYRWGLGVSFHEFELAIGEPLDQIVIADGLEQEMVHMFPVETDELALRRYFIDRSIRQPIGFSRAVLNLILQKPRNDEDRAANSARNARSASAERERLS